ncbi:MAG: 23S rRNA (uracil(1939)-C(5))-methyltransferase RlmD [Candidatus Diapherotrites archaeon]|nr:23S rRNA (uracil(1939)-C(5))-methyltransferase RlmD [Candidatus Diapherotrites archaeon]MDZ4256944.1 23S rRNA (uracil(1939)-C(5))-methyltransferase RlmD [archaeon]
MEDPFSICPHATVCNGCPDMNTPYEEQIGRKKDRVVEVLKPFTDYVEMVPAHALSFYRNRADFWFSPTRQLGYRSKENPYSGIPVPECQLVSPRAQNLYQTLEKRFHSNTWPPYSVLEHQGFLRYATVRESKTSGKLLLILNTFTRTPEDEERITGLAQELLSERLADGIIWMHNPHFNDAVQGDTIKTWGEKELVEDMSGIPFHYNSSCFFQTNPRMAEKVQEHVVQCIQEIQPAPRVLDLYCGVGLFAIPLIQKGFWVKGIEMNTESIGYARQNAQKLDLNGNSYSFEIGDVPKILQEMEKTDEQYDTIIFDPPRSGLSKKIWRRALRLKPTQLLYVACRLSSLERDLEWLGEYAVFDITSARAFDLFPHTPHVETVVDIRVNATKDYPKGGF